MGHIMDNFNGTRCDDQWIVKMFIINTLREKCAKRRQ